MPEGIKLRRKKIVMPDQGRTITVVWEDLYNPLRDENGVVIRTDVMNTVTGLLFPAYPEFVFQITIPNPAPTTQAEVDALIDNSPELQEAKRQAQTRANNITAKTSIRNFVNVLNSTNKIDFDGVYTIPT
jgi:hypothetical protein